MPDEEKPRLGRTLGIAAKNMRAHMDAGLAPAGTSLQSWVVMRNISHHPDLTQRELAARVGIEGPTLTHHLDRLGAEGLVERVRHPVDRRAYVVRLTPDGRSYLARAGRLARRLEAEMAARYDAEELATLLALLGRLHDPHDSPNGKVRR